MTIHLGGAMRRSKSPYGCGGWTGGWVGGELRIFLDKTVGSLKEEAISPNPGDIVRCRLAHVISPKGSGLIS